MKKLLLLAVTMLLAGGFSNAQQQQAPKERKSFLAITGGAAFPMGDFASKNMDNLQAGLATTGFNVNLHYGYQVNPVFGIAVTVPYSSFGVDNSVLEGTGLTMDHWQYYGLLAGPMYTAQAGAKTKFDFKMLIGATNVNSPKFTYHGEDAVAEDWSTSFAWQLGADVRMDIGKRAFFMGNLDYNSMQPKFSTSGEGSDSFEQKMSLFNLSVGIGIKL